MKVSLYHVFLVVLLCGFVSCSTDILSENMDEIYNEKETNELKSISVTRPDYISVYESPLTRSTIDDSDPSNLQLVWSETDTIGIFPNQGFQVAFPMISGAGSKSASFDGGGWGLQQTSSYSAYYPLIGQFYLDKTRIPLSWNGEIQTGNGSHAHIGSYDYMAVTNSAVNESGYIDFAFQPLSCLLHLKINMPQAGHYTKVLLESNGSLVKEATLNLTTGEVTATKLSPIQEVKLNGIVLDAENLTLEAYVVMRAIDLTYHTLTIKVIDEEGNIYAVDRGLGGREFVAGTIYHVRRDATLASESTGLPRVYINTADNATVPNTTDWLSNASILIVNADGSIDYESNQLQIKGRGNSTWSMPKKPYALKLKDKSEVLGMKKHKRWCLLANWMDRTLIRNDVAFQIAKQTQLSWTPSGKFVELILNGTHVGNYYLCEQIKVDKNRLNITEMKSTDIEGDAITGGYLMEMDTYFDEVNKFYSGTMNLPYMFKEPDEDVLQPEQLTYFQNYINTMESYLYDENWLVNREYADYMDIGSFVDWWFVYELVMNYEPQYPKSSYVHKDKLGKLKAGPVWDFDYATFIPDNANEYCVKNAIYYGRLFNDPVFVSEVKTRWANYKSRFDQIPTYIRSVATSIKKSNEVDYVMWPLSAFSSGAVNGDADLSFDDSIERLITAYTTKLNWLDTEISSMP